MAVPELLLATRNRHKVREVAAILGERFTVVGLDAVPSTTEVEETGVTFEDNADLKALAAGLHWEGWVVADDSGLEVDALGGAPGVRSARFAGEGADDAENIRLLLSELQARPAASRKARFRCVLTLARQGRVLARFEGTVEGSIAGAARGSGGFGYDPVFVPDGHSVTFAEMGAEAKNVMSHRGRALEALARWKGFEHHG